MCRRRSDRQTNEVYSFAIITTTPNELRAELHNRMPVVFGPEVWAEWLGEAADPPWLKALLAPYPTEEMVSWPVSPRVGNVKNNDQTLIEPMAGGGRLAGSGGWREVMNWHRWLAALFVTLALTGCAQAVPGQAHARYAPYSPENNGNMHDSGGGSGGGGGGSM
jgi:hypothetical protein